MKTLKSFFNITSLRQTRNLLGEIKMVKRNQ